ncbi:N-acetylmuramoyl-L-alanine amidase [Georgenia muralis]|uniref:N-acetylmuramoyl-L-alanine amidase n=1 Tax=Georgenia muralis TaxID=154117 RepID=A0A3N4YZQ1_9MICO|nr:N-acetylmuramoyl-L-alanine amidase [Georgenia muralis]RPF26589.1 N-acetylmuramoyl-L-alanine amidase [Georgenia muralis]
MSARVRSLLVALGALAVLAVAALGLVLGAGPLDLGTRPPDLAPGPPAGPAATPDPPSSATPAPTEEPGPLADLHVVLDPGHNGGNAAAPAQINAPVGDGRGGSKACNTVGSSTASGYPEHAFTLDVALRAREILRADGATVTLTREDDSGIGPCVDERGQSAGRAGADVLVSIHADGAADPEVRGYFAIVSEPPLNDAQAEPSRALAADLLAALGAAGFAPSSSYPGALSERADLGTLNWAERPAVLLELAEMRNPGEAELIESEEGRRRYAEAVAAGIRQWAAGR